LSQRSGVEASVDNVEWPVLSRGGARARRVPENAGPGDSVGLSLT